MSKEVGVFLSVFLGLCVAEFLSGITLSDFSDHVAGFFLINAIPASFSALLVGLVEPSDRSR